MDSSYAPPRQYTTSNFGQPPYLSDESPRKPYIGSHRGQHEDQPTPPPYRPPHSPTCWESPQYVPPIPLGYLLPHAVESRHLSLPYLRHDPSSPSLPVVVAVPPSTPPAPSCCPDVSRDEGELLHDDPPPPTPILQLYNPDISEENETLLEDK
ncbi:leucine-rich repeat extensin-like protein 3 [Salvia splendens]|uniref:leucine-rich repeat extensin-like protein 3 n=1 Tax=Salvia splendens TaxID=180675 RepID=UPI001C25EE61|nr:leucine-rich repeat extensin-like protein 3 [Salvia splendens]